ncbi:MAG: glycosyltransferase family 25 protein [Flavobacteriales bacterium]|nr:glycosyltransferase family 25 protein [Flavobacteriales bacterium]
MAATQTHVEIIYQNIVDQNVDYTLCLEDDTIVPSNFKQYVKDMYESLVTKQLDGAVLLNYHVHTPINLKELEAVLTVQETTIYKLPEQTKVGSGAAYIMSNQGAKSQVRSQSPIDRIGDWWHTHPDLNIYIVYPQVIETGKFSSTLGYQTSWAFRGLSFFIPKKIKEYIRIRKSKALSTQNIKI